MFKPRLWSIYFDDENGKKDVYAKKNKNKYA